MSATLSSSVAATNPNRTLLAASLISVLAHGLAFPLYDLAHRPSRTQEKPLPPPLLATLMPPKEIPPAEALLKNTLAKDDKPEEQKAVKPPPKPPQAPDPSKTPQPAQTKKKPSKEVLEKAQRKLNAQVFYPEEAVEKEWEGVVRLLIVLGPGGQVKEVKLAAGSGHGILDEAAKKAAWSMGALPDAGVDELILPVTFRLE